MSKTIIIAPFSRNLRNGKRNPKNWPYWKELVKELKKLKHKVIQVGLIGEPEVKGVDEFLKGKSLAELSELIEKTDTWISVDSFFPHLAHLQKKRGIVIFGQGNPEIFGHLENLNIFKHRKYFREKQFDIWESVEYNEEAFVKPDKVIEALNKM